MIGFQTRFIRKNSFDFYLFYQSFQNSLRIFTFSFIKQNRNVWELNHLKQPQKLLLNQIS